MSPELGATIGLVAGYIFARMTRSSAPAFAPLEPPLASVAAGVRCDCQDCKATAAVRMRLLVGSELMHRNLCTDHAELYERIYHWEYVRVVR